MSSPKEDRSQSTPPPGIREVGEGEWENTPTESKADAKWEHSIHEGSNKPQPDSRTGSPVHEPISQIGAHEKSSDSPKPVAEALLAESVSPMSGRGVSPPPLQIRSSFRVDSEDDENDGISVTPSPTNKGIQEKREFLPVSHVLKVIVLGDASVGKTALIQRFVHGSYQVLPYKPTVGADFYSQKLEFVNSNTGERSLVTLQIWDTAGQERYRSLASSFYRGADVCVLVYDGTRSSSLTSLELWKSDFLRHAQPNDPESFPFIFLRNKSDLLTVADSPPADELLSNIPEQFKAPKSRVLSVSAKSGTNVEKAFHLAAKVGVKRALRSSKLTMHSAAMGNGTSSSSRIVNLANANRAINSSDNYCQC